MRTADISCLDEARHLIACLSTELPTPRTSREAAVAERNAFAAILTLHERLIDRSAAAVAAEWKAA